MWVSYIKFTSTEKTTVIQENDWSNDNQEQENTYMCVEDNCKQCKIDFCNDFIELIFHMNLFYILGCDPTIMGIGPAPASRAALKSIGKDLGDMEIIDVRILVRLRLTIF